MAELKTQPTDQSVEAFLAAIPDDDKRKACTTLLRMMKQATGAKPKMWGESIVGFGTYRYVGASGRSGEWFLTGFSPRKANLTVYIIAGFTRYPELMEKLGKHKTGSSCLYINKLSDIDTAVLKELVEQSVEHVRENN
jgi:hypothetical protein